MFLYSCFAFMPGIDMCKVSSEEPLQKLLNRISQATQSKKQMVANGKRIGKKNTDSI